MPFKTN